MKMPDSRMRDRPAWGLRRPLRILALPLLISLPLIDAYLELDELLRRLGEDEILRAVVTEKLHVDDDELGAILSRLAGKLIERDRLRLRQLECRSREQREANQHAEACPRASTPFAHVQGAARPLGPSPTGAPLPILRVSGRHTPGRAPSSVHRFKGSLSAVIG
jgi:hypothetical protein